MTNFKESIPLESFNRDVMVNPETQPPSGLTHMRVADLKCSNCHHAIVNDVSARIYCTFNQVIKDFPADGIFGLVDGTKMSILPRIINGMDDAKAEIACNAMTILLDAPSDRASIDILEVSARITNALKWQKILTIWELCNRTEREIHNLQNLWPSSLKEIKVALAKIWRSLKKW